jgi:cellobiose-specific phosphotransferase system component IIB
MGTARAGDSTTLLVNKTMAVTETMGVRIFIRNASLGAQDLEGAE